MRRTACLCGQTGGLVAWVFAVIAVLWPAAANAEWLANGSPITAPDLIDQAPFTAVPDGSGGVLVGWGEFHWVKVSHITADGRMATGWPATGTSVDQDAYASFNPYVVSDDRQGCFVVKSSKWCEAHCAVDGTAVTAQHVRGCGVIAEGWGPHGVLVGTGLGPVRRQDVFAPTAIPDARGGLIVAWSGADRWGPFDLRAQRIDSTGALLWGEHGVEVRPASDQKYLPALVADGEGGALIIWRDPRAPGLYMQHLLASGVAELTPGGVPLAAPAFDYVSKPLAVMGGPNAVLVAWFGTTASASGLFATRIDMRGNRSWREPVQILEAGVGIDSLRLVSSGRGGAVLAWRDTRATTGETIFAQRLNENGHPLWARGGVPVCAAPGHKDYLALTVDDDGGAFVAWGDARPEGEVFATHLGSDGEPIRGWARNGTPVCAPIAALWAVQLVRGSYGDAFVLWTDDRRPLGDSFKLKTTQVMRLLRHGPAAPVPKTGGGVAREALVSALDRPADAPTFALHGMRPNPGPRGSVVSFTLRSDSPATLDLFDVAGRQVSSRDVGDLGAGEHVVPLAGGAWLPPGLYFARLTQGPLTDWTRVVVIR